MSHPHDVWLASGVRAPFANVDGALQAPDGGLGTVLLLESA